MNVIKKMILQTTLSYYGITKINFSKVTEEDDFGNLVFYKLEDGTVTIYTGSADAANVHISEFDFFVGDLCYCIHQSMVKGYYEPTFIMKRKRDLSNGKIRRLTEKVTLITLWDKRTFGRPTKNTKEPLEQV